MLLHVAKVFEPCLGILMQHQVYVMIIKMNINDLPDQDSEEKGGDLHTDV